MRVKGLVMSFLLRLRFASFTVVLAPLFFLPFSASAGLPGLDYLGGAKFCDAILEAHPPGAAAGFFIDTFGDAIPCIDRLAASGKATTFRVHLAWSDTHQFNPRDFDGIAAKARRLNGLAKKYPTYSFYVSGACEHNLNEVQAKILRAKVLAQCQDCKGYVNTPWRGARIDGLNEIHGFPKDKRGRPTKPTGAYLVSFDGVAAVDSDIGAWEAAHSDALIRFLWEPRFNGRWETNDNTPRPKRRGFADAKLIRSLAYVWNGKGSVRQLPRKWVQKSHSENHGTGDGRAEKPVELIRINADSIDWVATNGVRLASAKQYRPPLTSSGFSKKEPGHRFYAPMWGYELAEKARAVSGSRLVYLRVKGKNYGPINPAFREGSYRQ